MKAAVLAAAMAVWASVAAAAPAAPPPDAVFFNGSITTLDAAGSKAEAVAVKDGRFTHVGSSEAIRKLAGASTRLVDLGGRTVLPGFIDAHTHPMEAMMMKETFVDARYPETPSVKVALEHVAAWADKTPKGEWIFVAAV